MQTSKNHFEAKVVFNDETIRRMFRTEFYTCLLYTSPSPRDA